MGPPRAAGLVALLLAGRANVVAHDNRVPGRIIMCR